MPQVVCASTGKALCPYSPDLYTASNRAAQWIAFREAAGSRMLVSACRFTHVIDNSIIHQRLVDWAAGADGGVIRLYSSEIAFYVRSALESAQLLMLACLGSLRGEFRFHAITGLGWPVSLLDLALAVLQRRIPGYPFTLAATTAATRKFRYQGLYNPMTAGDVSPLSNVFGASAVVDSRYPMTDAFRLEMSPEPRAIKLLNALVEACDRTQDSDTVRGALDELSWSLLDATLSAAPNSALSQAAAAGRRHGDSLCASHQRVLDAIQDYADLGQHLSSRCRRQCSPN